MQLHFEKYSYHLVRIYIQRSLAMLLDKIVIIIFAAAIASIQHAAAYKILGIFPFISPSHAFMGNELMKGLCQAGHDVTVLTVKGDTFPSKNGTCKQILMEETLKKQQDLYRAVVNVKKQDKKNALTSFMNLITFAHIVMESTLNDSKVQELLGSGEKFDVVIVPHFVFEALKAFAPYFDAHLVLLNVGPPMFWLNQFIGNPSLPSINAEVFLGYTKEMDFSERFINTLVTLGIYLIRQISLYPSQTELVHKYISKDINLNDVSYNISLVLMNAHPSVNLAASSVPCMVDIAGYHIGTPKKLPDDLRKYMDDAEDGVIYFSLGSNVHISDLNMFQSFLKAFSKRKEKFLLKFHTTDIPGKPKNVRIANWFPQEDILAHPNTKLFITHGGFLSTIETVYYGVPTIAIPISGDQILNSRLMEDMGFTQVVDFRSITEEKLSAALDEVLDNEKYAKNAKMRSKIFHDRPLKPLDTAIYWIEYIARHNGAQHLRVNYLNLYWFQYYSLDVYGLIFSVIFLSGILFKKIISSMRKRIFGPKFANKLKNQ